MEGSLAASAPIFSRNDFIIIRLPIEYAASSYECSRLQSLGHKSSNSLL
jgi:hypothetical protein